MSAAMIDDLPELPAEILHDGPFDPDDPGIDENVLPDAVAHWRIESLGEAEWAMSHLARYTREVADLAAQRDEWARRIDRWFEQACAKADRRCQFFDGALTDYMQRTRTEDTKSIPVPSGVVTSRWNKEAVYIEDPDRVVAWAEEALPDDWETVVKVEKRPLVSELRKLVKVEPDADGHPVVVLISTDDGAIVPVPGVEVRPGYLTVTVHPNT